MLVKTKTGIPDPKKRALLLSALYIAQEQFGWLSPEAIQRVADRLDLATGKVISAASFYSMFKLEPYGRFHIQVCEGLSCYLSAEAADTIAVSVSKKCASRDGVKPLVDHLQEKLRIKPGETSPDGRFSLEIVQCLAACDVAPALKVNDELYGNLTVKKLDALLESLGWVQWSSLDDRGSV